VSPSLKILFMGTPDFAVPCLCALDESRFNVVMVVTRPDRPKGRGRKISPPPIKSTAVRLGYPVIQPESLKSDEFLRAVESTAPDVFVVVAYGRILSERVLGMPAWGAINVHASLLPKYRGAAPIQWAIINGETETGVTTMRMDKGLDTGNILLAAREPVQSTDTAATLRDRLARLGGRLLIETLEALIRHDLKPIPQDDSQATYAPMLSKEDGRIDWHKPAERLDCFIRGVTPWPGAFTFHQGQRLKVFKASVVAGDHDVAPGTVLPGFPDELRVATGKGIVSILEIQSASGKRLAIGDFLRGCALSPGTGLG
jgi:methionyl-tRNA formyltransferase